jgi:FAD/FMN-containing dehydrogenase
MTEISESELKGLTARLGGRVHRPCDAAYAGATASKSPASGFVPVPERCGVRSTAARSRPGCWGWRAPPRTSGVAGYTFGGGVGWLTRAYGLASSRLRAVEFVDGKGSLRRADENTDTDALWTFRGGGGAGIATALEFDLVPVASLHAGFWLWPVAEAEQVLDAWGRVAGQLPAAVTSSIGLLKAPGAPVVDEWLRGQRVVHLSLACLDDPGGAAALLDVLPRPAQDTFGPCDASRLGQIHLDPPTAVPAVGQGLWLDDSAAGSAMATSVPGAFVYPLGASCNG